MHTRFLGRILAPAFGAIALLTLGLPARAQIGTQTGTFTGPLTNGLLLSVDVNGGEGPNTAPAQLEPTEGYNPTGPTFGTDTYGVTWSPWGGSTSFYGDGTFWPDTNNGQSGNTSTSGNLPPATDPISGATLTNNVNWFQKVFGGLTVTVSAPGTASNYNASTPLNSRDRGAIYAPGGSNGSESSGETYPVAGEGAAYDGDMFRSLIFGAVNSSNSNVQGTNYLQLTISGLTPGTTYALAGYAYDDTGGHEEVFTATAPTVSNGLAGWWASSPVGNNTFTPPSDEQIVNWLGTKNSILGVQAPAVFDLTANGSGSVTVWTFGGDGQDDQNSGSSYLDGFQIAVVPEPASLSIVAIGALGLLGRRRKA